MKKILLIVTTATIIASFIPTPTLSLSCSCLKYAYDTKNTGNTYGGCIINPEKLGLAWRLKVNDKSEEKNRFKRCMR